MKKKFFSLLSGTQIHLGPGVKRIPADSFSQLVEGKAVFDAIQEDAEAYRLQVAKEGEEVKERAFRQGYEEGFAQWAEKISEMEQERDRVRKEMEKLIVPAAVKGAQKIIGRELEVSEATIVDIVANHLKSVSQHKKITVHVNTEDFHVVDKKRDSLKALFENLESFTVVPREDVEKGGCIIETEGGIINAELPNLWALLERAFEQLFHEGKE